MTQLIPFLENIIKEPFLHAKWLNTLSYLENCGARKLAAFEHPTKVKEEMLKHAAEEFRHAHFLKKEISKIYPSSFSDYAPSSLLGGFFSLHYLNRLELEISRLLKPQISFKELSYLTVTYAIEIRAKDVYFQYETLLRKHHLPIHVKSIYFEEAEHLNEILSEMNNYNVISSLLPLVKSIENAHWNKWFTNLASDQQLHETVTETNLRCKQDL